MKDVYLLLTCRCGNQVQVKESNFDRLTNNGFHPSEFLHINCCPRPLYLLLHTPSSSDRKIGGWKDIMKWEDIADWKEIALILL